MYNTGVMNKQIHVCYTSYKAPVFINILHFNFNARNVGETEYEYYNHISNVIMDRCKFTPMCLIVEKKNKTVSPSTIMRPFEVNEENGNLIVLRGETITFKTNLGTLIFLKEIDHVDIFVKKLAEYVFCTKKTNPELELSVIVYEFDPKNNITTVLDSKMNLLHVEKKHPVYKNKYKNIKTGTTSNHIFYFNHFKSLIPNSCIAVEILHDALLEIQLPVSVYCKWTKNESLQKCVFTEYLPYKRGFVYIDSENDLLALIHFII